mmetsp:Transcript_18082/g.37879  ORF Transcript_18082/g.37879 Transcript_18082/m.37879 type:complete len:529 (-) Transcript_18082:247-1833(-)|eukprot:CAMPEP_0182531990 /NCGR_PEP_ID=MMETSP1323-20130603/10428_1 /TAXON_ID=236787 /ORGANISM="Florenciella parvula, Strain RCC1693" /LENGTH=528 /DNA_ID=CAMNT_0024741655 /DNA_START=78 /DNA_END=1664 /DNA_ORIENTATION=+
MAPARTHVTALAFTALALSFSPCHSWSNAFGQSSSASIPVASTAPPATVTSLLRGLRRLQEGLPVLPAGDAAAPAAADMAASATAASDVLNSSNVESASADKALAKKFQDMYIESHTKVAMLEAKVKTLEETSKVNSDKVTALEEEKIKLGTAKETMAMEIVSATQAKDSLSNELAAKKTELETLQASLTSSQSNGTALTAQIAELKLDVAKKTEDLKTLQQTLDEREAQLLELENELAIVREKAENPDLVFELQKRGNIGVQQIYQTNPGLAAAVNKTVDMLLPALIEKRMAGAQMLNSTHHTIKDSIKTMVPDQYLPMISGFLVYGLVFIPLFLTFWCLASVHAVLKLRPLLTFLHLYLALVSIISAGAAFVLKADPLTTFQNQDHETYIFTQGLMGVVFVFYSLLLVVAFLRSRNNTEWLIRVVQLAGALTIASLYYQLFWEPAMLEKPPRLMFTTPGTFWVPYAVAAVAFAIILRMERVQRQAVAEDPAVPTDVDEDVFRITVDVNQDGAGEGEGQGGPVAKSE